MPSFTRSIALLLLFLPLFAKAAGTHEYRLNNGLKLIIKEDHRTPAVVSQIWYKVGSSDEPNGITGISHALEHMMFQGTKTYLPGQFSKIIADNGGQENAFTDYDFTGYYELLSADKLPIAFKLEADRMQNLLLRHQEFSKEKQVIIEERRLRTDDNPQMKTYERLIATAHISSPYHHPPIGWIGDIQQLTTQDLRQWYEQWYAPNNAIIVIVGDVNPHKVYLLAKHYFGAIKPRQISTPKLRQEQQPLGERIVVVKVPAKLPWLAIAYNVPSLKTANSSWQAYTLDVIASILAGGDSARLTKELVREQQVATDINVSYELIRRFDTLFILSGTPEPTHNVKELQAAFLQQIKQLQTTLPSAQELTRIKAQVIANKIYSKDSIADQATEIGELESVGLSWKETDNYVKNIEAVTPEQVRIVAKKYLTPDRLTVGILKPLPLSADASSPTPKAGDTYVR